MDLIFEWDEKKAERNLKIHGIAFEDAIGVFQDDNRIEYYDSEHSTEEDRYVAIGMVGSVLFVVFTVRTDVTRIISARKATAKERRSYYGYSSH